MRAGLVDLIQCGIKRTKFSAIFSGISRCGHIILTDIRTPIGMIPYTWASQSAWKGKLHIPGDEVHFEASIVPYDHKYTRKIDLGFDDIQEVPV